MEDRHGRDEKGLSEKDEGAASNDQQERERRHHSSHRKKGHRHRSKKTKTSGHQHSPRKAQSIENERRIAGTVASPPSSYTVVGNNNARQHHDLDRNDNQRDPNGMQLLHVCLSLVLSSSFHHCMMHAIQ